MNPWLFYVNQFRARNPQLSYKECLQHASKSYTKQGVAATMLRQKTIAGGDFASSHDELSAALEASYVDNNAAAEMLAKYGYELDHALSGQRAKVFVDRSGQPFIAFRGTSNFGDVKTDVGAYFGVKGKRVAHSKLVVSQVREKYGREPNVLGHSLGGWLAENAKSHGEVTTYNKLATGRTKKNSSQTDVRDSNDAVSLMSKIIAPKNIEKKTVKSKSWNPLTSHGMKGLKNRNRK